jgi:hypothetical protein
MKDGKALLSKINLAFTVCVVLLIAGCRMEEKREASIGDAYVGPAILKIRSDIPLESRVVATTRHGDRLEVLQRRRRFLKVRVSSGIEGWTEERQLLAAEDMAELRNLFERAAKLPSQGQATVFGELNVHTQPARQSPSFFQIKEGEKVDVVAHVAMPRNEQLRKLALPGAVKKQLAPPRRPLRQGKFLLPLPKPPEPPDNWLELSKTDLAAGLDAASAEKPVAPAPKDDWSLVRTANGQAGWALTPRLVMAIPDEVAQYAEGRRIVSYFSLGDVQDGDQTRHIWLWTTINDGEHEYSFDSFRVFVWSLRRHRYETAYIERNLQGYDPVLLKRVVYASGAPTKTAAAQQTYPGFSICREKADGRYRREYALLGNIVRAAGEDPCEAPQAPEQPRTPPPLQVAASPSGGQQSFAQRFKRRLRAFTRGWFGG